MYTSGSQGGLLRSNPRSGSGSLVKRENNNSQSPQNSISGELDNNSDGKTISITHMDEYIGEYSKYRDTPVENLNKDAKNKLIALGNLLGVMRSTGSHYDKVLEIIKKHFGNPSTIKPETVGHFFFGCSAATDYKGPVHCSANCAGNVVPPQGPGFETCSDNVYYLNTNGQLDLRISSDSKKAIIHVLKNNYSGLTRAQIADLRRRNIEVVDINIVSSDFKHTVVSENIPLSEIDIQGESQTASCASADYSRSSSNDKSSSGGNFSQSNSGSRSNQRSASQSDYRGGHPGNPPHHDNNKNPTNYTWVGALIFIIIVIVIVLLLFAVFRNRRSLDRPESSSSQGLAGVNETSGVNDTSEFWSGYGSTN